MKHLYVIGGTMGIGKTTVCEQMKRDLPDSVFLDGDWCWDSDPFQVTGETKTMVVDNITYMLNNFIHCSAYENIIFCWVLHEQEIMENIFVRLDLKNCKVINISLLAAEECLRERISKDMKKGLRTADVLDRSLERLPLYQNLDTIKIDTTGKSVQRIADEIESIDG